MTRAGEGSGILGAVSLEPGTVVGGEFEIVGPLSAGGMGAVYVAQQKSVGRRRALKVMHRELLADAKLRDRFVQEAKIGATIESEHVVEVIAAGIDEQLKMPWLAMEMLEGKDLATLISSRGRLPVGDVREVMDQLCHALAAAHATGIVHRDLKPENVFVARTRRRGSPFVVKVLDFGIAKVLAEARATSAATAALGTPTFMAPEQTESRSKVAPAADVWALGLIVFRALTGKHYWNAANDDGASLTALMRELVIDPIVPASERASSLGVAELVPSGFDAWFASCVARDPKARFADAGVAHKALIEVDGFDAPGPTTLHEDLAPERASAVEISGTKPSATVAAAPLKDAPAPSATVAAAPLKDAPAPNMTVAAAPLSDRPRVRVAERAATRGGQTIAAGPVDLPERDSPPGRSRVGVAVGGLALVAVGVGIYLATSGGGGEQPAASASGPHAPASSAPQPTVKTGPSSAPASSSSNRWVEITPPFTQVLLGVPDDAPPDRRGVRASRWVTSPTEKYAIQAREVSWAELAPFLAATPTLAFERPASVPKDAPARADLPAVGVPWEVADQYCRSIGGNLPDEAQWELAARGNPLRSLPWGNGPVELGEVRAFLGPGGEVSRVAGTPRDVTPEGVHDLMGNAREWTSTIWYADSLGQPDAWAKDGETTARVVRGWPLRAERPSSLDGLDAAYRDWVCATGACSPLHPDLTTKPPLAPLTLTTDPGSPGAVPSPLREWVESERFKELFGRCTAVTPLAVDLRVTLSADAKGCTHASVAPRGALVPVVFAMGALEEPSPYVFAQDTPVGGGDRDGDGIPDRKDMCVDAREDADGFEDSDGCPELDNDGDGILDAKDQCPLEPETKNGFQDEDGCPDKKLGELMPPPPPPPPPPPRTVPSPSSPPCKPSEAALASKDLPPRFLQCLQAGAPMSLTSTTAWKDQVTFSVKLGKVPPALAEIGFRCVRRP
jgi:serine/threonine protein kinase/formylglycine-generating enzyme required for sulfatase activity